MVITLKQPPPDPTTQRTSWEIAPRVARTISPSEFRAQDLTRIRDLAQRCVDFGKHVGFWIDGDWYKNNSEAGASRLTWDSSFLDNRGAILKRLVCGESAHFMMQRLMVHAGDRDYYSDLHAYMAIAKGSLDMWRSDANFITKFHVWVEIATSAGGAPVLKIDLWGAGTGSGPLFPDGPPMDCIRNETQDDFALRFGSAPGIGAPPTGTMNVSVRGRASWRYEPPANPSPLP